jgi:hypothetical protein
MHQGFLKKSWAEVVIKCGVTFPVTYYTNICSRVMFSSGHALAQVASCQLPTVAFECNPKSGHVEFVVDKVLAR